MSRGKVGVMSGIVNSNFSWLKLTAIAVGLWGISTLTVSLAPARTQAQASGEVNIYSYRQPYLIAPLLKEFTRGLGLPITKALVDANDGTFTLKSEPGEGTEISLRFHLVSKS